MSSRIYHSTAAFRHYMQRTRGMGQAGDQGWSQIEVPSRAIVRQTRISYRFLRRSGIPAGEAKQLLVRTLLDGQHLGRMVNA